ncbi:DUF3365 domain-containing protein [Rheinheimera sediminis]|uniref:Tll0287-like domain-containing protein n=1 Tax=Rheinheimera sp. YQF-1 TaxID=2499626 RepID=UPI000FD86833|nr:DUF3365 domain-containing protein [Rheinheimera sp. YQF-1]RVT41386.1 DUF3365 domain-containing protein [Rheinheimera sp. YQF-1]
MFKRTYTKHWGITLALCVSLPVAAQTIESLTAEAQARIKLFSAELKSNLMQATKQGGPVNGVQACHIIAPEIQKKLAKDGWIVARTALKYRNPANKPDQWEQQNLLQMLSAHQKGEPLVTMAKAEIIELQGKKTFRYLKAIPMDTRCTACHGEHITEEVKTKISTLYPADSATGFTATELRGAFTVQKSIL